ncbi:PIN domain-containing protein [Chryseobacterium sp. Ch-15]|uniref:DUF4935 domain-containing protein n=1 Tax=Chryseobacterium muglaense TaxID=2893752 RepID=A0A9Q3YRQ5_9FLAO|nr:PIN domain-containing protein [Chryseobacterium muglaense]MBD3906883.1 DUF4935 domain-containing protein [Chryseobacterium muglaense]MCC9033037.1 PIN domain-containing protein [Chryseobacterium muglaense]MCM2556625.1 PIN domain-containing protein [Chryseobacterium muglaense]
MLKTRNVYIDTEVFISNNFFDSTNLKRLFQFGKDETINLYLTEITENEIRNNIREEILTTQNELNLFKKNIASKGKVLKNFEKFKPYFDLPKLEIDLNLKELSNKLEEFIGEGKIKYIPYELADIKVVVDKYFKQMSPFNGGKKKHEFPDAIVLSAIENWCKKYDQKIYFISGDPDFKTYTSGNIIILPNLKILLDQINRQLDIDKKKLIDWILSVFEYNEHIIIEKINEKFVETIYDEIGYTIEATNIEVIETTLFDPSFVQENDSNDEYIFQIDFDINFTAQIIFDDHSLSFYDKEDDCYYNVGKAQRSIEMHITKTAEIAIEAHYELGEEPESAGVSVTCTYTSTPSEYDLLDEAENDYD